jgi:hypothetical protein
MRFSDESLYHCAAPYGVKISGAGLRACGGPGLAVAYRFPPSLAGRVRAARPSRAGIGRVPPAGVFSGPAAVSLRGAAAAWKMAVVPPVTPLSLWSRLSPWISLAPGTVT